MRRPLRFFVVGGLQSSLVIIDSIIDHTVVDLQSWYKRVPENDQLFQLFIVNFSVSFSILAVSSTPTLNKTNTLLTAHT